MPRPWNWRAAGPDALRQVMLDSDLAELYQAKTRTLIQAVKRNHDRFPEDFMFQLTKDESDSLRSQIVISNLPREAAKSQRPLHAFSWLRRTLATSKRMAGGDAWAWRPQLVKLLKRNIASRWRIPGSIAIRSPRLQQGAGMGLRH